MRLKLILILSISQEISHRSPTERSPMIAGASSHGHPDVAIIGRHSAIGFGGALKIPGVIEFSLCLFFSKLVSYTFLYWLPHYIQSSCKLNAQSLQRPNDLIFR